MTLASTYDSGSYGGSTYNGQTTTSSVGSVGGTTGDPSGGVLTNTGIVITVIVSLAAVTLLAALIVRIWKRPSAQVLEPVEVRDDEVPTQ